MSLYRVDTPENRAEVMALFGGAECSTAGNPLTQFTKHVQDDKSLQRDRLAGAPPRLQESVRSRSMMGGQDHVCCSPHFHLAVMRLGLTGGVDYRFR